MCQCTNIANMQMEPQQLKTNWHIGTLANQHIHNAKDNSHTTY